MKRFLVMITLSGFTMLPAFSQPNNETQVKPTPEKLYLPAVIIDNPAALAKAIPGLAQQVLSRLPKKGTPYYRQAATYYLLAGEYKNALDVIDSVRKADEDPFWRSFFKTYIQARMIDDTEGTRFKQTFQKEFAADFNKYPFGEKVGAAEVDSIYIQELNKEYKNAIADLKKNGSDSITLADAKDLLHLYTDWVVYNKILPLVAPYTNNPKYKISFPVIKSNSWGGVFPVDGIDEVPDPKLQYRFLMELTSFGFPKQEDSVASKDMNIALRSVARTINLHVGAGIPKENIDVVLAVHAKALNVFLNNEKYKKKYGIDNPNMPLLKELQDFGIKFTLCGQAMHYQGLTKENFIPGVKVALTSQTVISSYQLKGYVFSDLSLRE